MRADPRLMEDHSPNDFMVVSWEEANCPLCENARCIPLLEAADPRRSGMRFLVMQCARCEFTYTNPRPDADSILAFYENAARNDIVRAACPRYGVSRSDAMHRRLRPFGQARLFDFGCGDGAFLERMQESGWTVAGVDINEDAVASTRAVREFCIEVGTLPDPRWTPTCFEAITMRQSLEHVHHPLESLRAANELLVPGGILMVSVPNFASLAASWFGTDWFALDLPRHLSHFTPVTLQTMLEKAGFDRIEIHADRHASWVRRSAERMCASDVSGMVTRWLRTRIGSRLFSVGGMLLGRPEGILAIARK